MKNIWIAALIAFGSLAADCIPDCGFYMGADFLYWTAYENDLDYVQTGSTETEISGTTQYVEYEWDPGFRVFGGYRWGCDGWGIRAVYTYFEANDHDQTVNEEFATPLDTYLLHPVANPVNFDPDRVAASVELDYGTLDVLFTKEWCVSYSLSARPFFGFRALWLDRDFNAVFTEDLTVRRVDWCCDTDGYGAHAGIEWQMSLSRICPGFGCRFFFAGSLLAAHSEATERQQSLTTLYLDSKERQRMPLFGYDLGGNFSWDFCCESAWVSLSAGYELHFLGGLQQRRRYSAQEAVANYQGQSGSCTNGKLLLHGLTVKGEVFF